MQVADVQLAEVIEPALDVTQGARESLRVEDIADHVRALEPVRRHLQQVLHGSGFLLGRRGLRDRSIVSAHVGRGGLAFCHI